MGSKKDKSKVKRLTKLIKPEKIPAGKIQCQVCFQLIQEGLTFCPECGKRIPEFLRFNPKS